MNMQQIHPHAVIAPGAKLGPSVQVGAFAVVSAGVELGEGCILHPHAVVQGPSKIGRNNVLHPFCVVGGDPQDLKFHGEHTELSVGDGNTFREYVTVSRGTVGAVAKPPSAAAAYLWPTRTSRMTATWGTTRFLPTARRSQAM
jgi:acyl-ACP--UDP-N-acetylglucosamine O-acyltransferase